MSFLSNNINVNIRFQRSTRIDSDLDDNGDFFNGFVFHGTAENTLRTIVEGYHQSNRKTYTITGPYGSGKSTIALLLAGLLSTQKTVRKVANKVVGEQFSEFFAKKVEVKKGWFTVKTVCRFESPMSFLYCWVIVDQLVNSGWPDCTEPTVFAIEGVDNGGAPYTHSLPPHSLPHTNARSPCTT